MDETIDQALRRVDAKVQINAASGQLISRIPAEEDSHLDSVASAFTSLDGTAKNLRLGDLQSVVVATDSNFTTSSVVSGTLVTAEAKTLDRAQLATHIVGSSSS